MTYRTGSVFIPDQRAIILYMECQPLRSLCDYAHVGVLYTFSNISAAGFAMSSQLSSHLARKAVQYVMAGGTARPLQYKSSLPLPLSSS
jgi:hypothetical protein